MKKAGKVTALCLIVLLTTLSTPAAGAGGVITNPAKIHLVGPIVDEVDYSLPADPIAAQSPNHAIMGNEISLDLATYLSFASDAHLMEGKTQSFSNVGISFNMMRAVVNNTHFRRAILYLMDFSYYQNVMLSSVEGTASPTVLPCALYLVSCHNAPHGLAAETIYGRTQSMTKAIAELKATESDPNPNSRLYLVETNSTDCSLQSGGCAGFFTWHVGSPAGSAYSPNWLRRSSLHRNDIAVTLQGWASKIGLDLASHYYNIAFPHICSREIVCQPPSVVIKDGIYQPSGPDKGYNTPPIYNWTLSNNAACPDGLSITADCWDMNLYGYEFHGPALLSVTHWFNSAFGSSVENPSLYYNRSMDYVTNRVIYATTVTGALTAAGKVDLYFMQNLPWINVYFENTLWAVLSDAWTGYAAVPTQGPNSLAGLFYTLLNVHRTCFPTTCRTGGILPYGLSSAIDTPGGLTPMANFNSVYDADITDQIYESPTVIGPTQFTSPSKYTNWMLSYNGRPAAVQSPALAIRTAAFNDYTGYNPLKPATAGIWTDFQVAGVIPGTLSSTQQRIVHGQRFTLTFAPGIYFSDHVQMTAYDYNFSLYVADVASSPTLPDLMTPYLRTSTGPSGLIATHINPAKPLTIEIFVNSTSVFNLQNLIVPVIPLHIFRYFDVNMAYSPASTFDTSFNYANTILPANGCSSCVATNQGTISNATLPWLFALPNLEVGTGPFILRSWNGTSQQGHLLRNVNYYRAAWNMNITNNQVKRGDSFNFTQQIYEWTYDPVACARAADKVCKVPITSLSSATLDLVNRATGATIHSFTLACNTGALAPGYCSGIVPTALGSGFTSTPLGSELRLTATYSYLGLARTWYQLTGVLVHP